jgi:CheY-like chemotaxis protein
MDDILLLGKKILIVEDDFSSRLYLNKVLEKSGAILLNAVDGKEALEMVHSNSDIDIILMDIQLPVIDGYSCTKILRDSGNNMVIIAQTAYGLTGDKEKMMTLGFNDFLIKPIGRQQLFDKISLYLSGN